MERVGKGSQALCRMKDPPGPGGGGGGGLVNKATTATLEEYSTVPRRLFIPALQKLAVA
jgi:hypothetical protein